MSKWEGERIVQGPSHRDSHFPLKFVWEVGIKAKTRTFLLASVNFCPRFRYGGLVSQAEDLEASF